MAYYGSSLSATCDITTQRLFPLNTPRGLKLDSIALLVSQQMMILTRIWTDLQYLVSCHGATIILCCVLSYRVLLVLYRLSPVHPLHKFPGPKLAAASYLYELWFDLIKGGQYTFEIKRLHDTYGKSTPGRHSTTIR